MEYGLPNAPGPIVRPVRMHTHPMPFPQSKRERVNGAVFSEAMQPSMR